MISPTSSDFTCFSSTSSPRFFCSISKTTLSGNSQYHAGRVTAATRPREWPAYSTLAGLTAHEHVSVYWEAPWLRPPGLEEEGLLDQYVVNGQLPDQVPVSAVLSSEWKSHCYIPDNLVSRQVDGRRVPLPVARQRLTRRIYERIDIMGIRPIEADLGFDPWVYRNYDEELSGRVRHECLSRAGEQPGNQEVAQAALGYITPLLPRDFETNIRFDTPGFRAVAPMTRDLRDERRWRARFACLVPYQAKEVEQLKSNVHFARYVPIPVQWREWETPRGLLAAMPPILTYAWSTLLAKPQGGEWAVFYIEWVAEVTAAWLWELFSTGRLFWLPPTIIDGI